MFAPRDSSPPNTHYSFLDVAAHQIKLDRVLGLTVGSNAALDCSATTGLLAYPAGCTVVLFNPKRSRQQQHLSNSSRKSVTSVCFSSDGKHLATGESGHAPCVRVWDLDAGTAIAEFPGHKYAVNCVAFSPNGKYLVSVGSQHDMIVNVWDWRSGAKLASNKVSARVKAVSFAENGAYFVTVGNRHVKFWYLECARVAKQFKEPVPLMGRSAILGEQRNNDFVDVCCGRGQCGDSTYAITRSGLLCEFNHRRLLEKWVELRTPSANCMSVGERLIFIGCADGIVRCFDPATMQFVTTLPRTHCLGVDVAMGTSIGHMLNSSPTSKYPDTIAVSYDEMNGKLTCVYNDHSLYIWDVRDIKRVGKSNSFLYHSACIWGVETPNSLVHMNMSPNSKPPALPQNCFVTCSSDDTIRIWNLDENHHIDETSNFKRNIYSKELLKVLYVDQELTYLKDMELSPTTNSEKSTSYDGRNGVRSIRISPDGEQLASGDRSGNIRIHSLRNFQELYQLEAHDAEVLCLEYTQVNGSNVRDSPPNNGGRKLLASASRDRLIHVFDVDDEYNFIQTLDDHSSSITSVRFLGSGGNVQMVSCGADKSIIFRQLMTSPGGTENFQRGHNCSGKTTLYDMEVDSNHKHVLTACQDRNIRVYNTQTGKHTKTFKGSASDEGTLIKVSLDSSGIYVATSCTDKTLSVYDYYSGECMATMLGHSELVTGLRFSNDCRYLISASGDGCIFIWKVPHDMVVTMQARLSQQALRMGRKPQVLHNESNRFNASPTDMFEAPAQSIAESADYRFNLGQLPSWAKKQISDPTEIPNSENSPVKPPEPPRGRWAQRADTFNMRSQFDTNNIIPYGSENRLDSDGSKDSSLDSGTEVKSYKNLNETITLTQNLHANTSRGAERGKHTDDSSLGSLRMEDLESTEHDGDVEDYSDGERTSSDHVIMYYPENSDTPTDFTVNAMDVEELRKSQRRHKAKKSGLTLKLNPDLISGTSVSGSQDSEEDDDDTSTPSGDNADRSLASTLGGSTESLNGKGFLQTALDGPASKVEGKSKSYSSKHLLNTSGSPPAQHVSDMNNRNASVIHAARQNKPETKREELQRRMEETKRILQSDVIDKRISRIINSEVGYRSSLKSSQSISDLSRSGTVSSARTTRQQNSGRKNLHTRTNLTLNDMNAHPNNYTNTKITSMKPYNPRPYNLDLNVAQQRRKEQIVYTGNAHFMPQNKPIHQHPSVLKQYKSCPVSPVSEEISWGQLQHLGNPGITYMDNKRLSCPVDTNYAKNFMDTIHQDTEKMIAEITQKYGDLDDYDPSKKTLNVVKSKTCDNFVTKGCDMPREHNFLSDDETNFSSDSLEDCSLDLDVPKRNKKYTKKTCHKHNKPKQADLPKRSYSNYEIFSDNNMPVASYEIREVLDNDLARKPKSFTLPKNMPSNLDMYGGENYDYCMNDNVGSQESIQSDNYLDMCNKNVRRGLETTSCYNLNDINYTNSQRYSSASFFLSRSKMGASRSQESFLSDDFLSDNDDQYSKTNCNSLESILSDDNDGMRSAPLEKLFYNYPKTNADYQTAQAKSFTDSNYFPSYSNKGMECSGSKSYGNSPNTSYFEHYMTTKRRTDSEFRGIFPTSSNVGLLKVVNSDESTKRSAHDSNRPGKSEDIPTLQSKAAQYNTVSRSLRKEYDNQKYKYMSEMEGCEPIQCSRPKPIPKACSFEIPFRDNDKSTKRPFAETRNNGDNESNIISNLESGKSNKFFENLAKFEKSTKILERLAAKNAHKEKCGKKYCENYHNKAKMDVNLTMDFVAHKPPKPVRRTSSVKGRTRTKFKAWDKYSANTSETDKVWGNVNQDTGVSEEKSFHVFVKEKELLENKSSTLEMDSLEYVNLNKKSANDVCYDSLEVDINIAEKDCNSPNMKPDGRKNVESKSAEIEPSCSTNVGNFTFVDSNITRVIEMDKQRNAKYINNDELTKFRDIERKIDIINKLVEMEERKLEQEKYLKEQRMRPITVQKGQSLVKSISQNFEKLFSERSVGTFPLKPKHIISEISENKFNKIKRNFSLPDVLAEAKLTTYECNDEVFETTPEIEEVEFLEEEKNDSKQIESPDCPKVAWLSPPANEGLRKACSLSDLSSPTQSKKNIVVSGKMQNKPQPVPRKLSMQKQNMKSGMGQRSVSTGVLNQSDSESDMNNLGAKRFGGLMRPTISSQNKTNAPGTNGVKTQTASLSKFSKSTKNGSNNRRRMQNSYSSVNLTTIGNEDSSSEEIGNSSSCSTKPTVPPRPRSISIDHTRRTNRSGSDREMSARPREVTNRLTGGGSLMSQDKHVHYEDQSSPVLTNNSAKLPPSPLEIPCKDTDTIDITNAELSVTFCKQLSEQLTKTAENVVQLYKRLSISECGSSNGDLSAEAMLKGLENAMLETQRKFQMATLEGNNMLDSVCNKSDKFLDNNMTNDNNSSKTLNGNDDKPLNINSMFNQSVEVDRLQNLVTNSENVGSNNMVQFMQQYSDILLSVMQQKIAGTQKKA